MLAIYFAIQASNIKGTNKTNTGGTKINLLLVAVPFVSLLKYLGLAFVVDAVAATCVANEK